MKGSKVPFERLTEREAVKIFWGVCEEMAENLKVVKRVYNKII